MSDDYDSADRSAAGDGTSSGEDVLPADFARMRVGYGAHEDERLDPADLADGWFPLFSRWLADAESAGNREPNAMVLATVGVGGTPSTRTVLCKRADADGIVFYTTRTSRKGRQIGITPRVSVTFPWIDLERQVHLEGTCAPVSEEETLAYWRTRPRGAQLAAWASDQSRVVGSVDELDARLAEVHERFGGRAEVPVPERWGGYRLTPLRAEFWQGGRDRFHDRLECVAAGEGWSVRRLQP